MLGAILAGGASTRMGRDKAQLALPDGRLMARAVGETLAAVCDGVVVVGPAMTPGWAPAAWPCVADRAPGLGPAGGIEALLASGLDDDYLVCPCDVPRVSATLLTRLLEPGAHAVAFAGSPLPLRIRASCLPEVEAFIERGGRAVHELLDAIAAQRLRLTPEEAGRLHNVNAPDDLESL